MKLSDIKYIEFVYKTGFKPAIKYTGWDDLLKIVKHKKGRKPVGFRCYTENGIWLLDLQPDYSKWLI